jgi:DNA-binding transcriptional MerR regulator
VRRPDGRPVDDRTLRFWEENGIIPRGIEGKIDGRGYTYRLYPWWIVDLLYQACCYQKADVRLGDLPVRMRQEAQSLSLGSTLARPKNSQQYGEKKSFWSYISQALREPTLPPFVRPLFSIGDIQSQLNEMLQVFALSQEREGIGRAERARVQLFDSAGMELSTYETDFRYTPLSPERKESLTQAQANIKVTVAPSPKSGTTE